MINIDSKNNYKKKAVVIACATSGITASMLSNNAISRTTAMGFMAFSSLVATKLYFTKTAPPSKKTEGESRTQKVKKFITEHKYKIALATVLTLLVITSIYMSRSSNTTTPQQDTNTPPSVTGPSTTSAEQKPAPSFTTPSTQAVSPPVTGPSTTPAEQKPAPSFTTPSWQKPTQPKTTTPFTAPTPKPTPSFTTQSWQKPTPLFTTPGWQKPTPLNPPPSFMIGKPIVEPSVGGAKKAFLNADNNDITLCVYESDPVTRELSNVLLEQHITPPLDNSQQSSMEMFRQIKKLIDAQKIEKLHAIADTKYGSTANGTDWPKMIKWFTGIDFTQQI